ncbi:hypothetical protein QC823_13425 [Halomonas vilamensis]|uniref:Uncharacterized protein n=1 Tax=Vreelandella vilamensis TaxID=531309 RepID=A0ABU1H8E3_9GAMM|nr:hypothetical protein [Halomonas vilamensis]MDR5899987.1 hypothetical protein [Halomonas vilamensis]
MSKYDWETINADYRTGQHSVRALATKHAVTEGAIRKRARTEGWQRDLSQHVKTATHAKLVRSESTQNGTHLPDDDQALVESAADTNVRVITGHRQAIGRWKSLGNKLATTLESIDVTADNVADFARTLNSGVDSLGKCIRLERQAFGLDSETSQEESPFSHMTMEELDAEINALLEKRSAAK